MFKTATLALCLAVAVQAANENKRCEEGWQGLVLEVEGVSVTPSYAFGEVDEDDNGHLDKCEFRDLFMDYDAIDGTKRDHRDVYKCFRTFDLNDDGRIDNYEYNLLLHPTVEFRCAHAVFQSANGSATYGWA